MKFKVVCIALALLLLVGCSGLKEKDDKKLEENKEPKQEEKKVEEEKKKEESSNEFNGEALLDGDRSSIAGDYENANGEIITVYEDGTLDFHGSMGITSWERSNQVVGTVNYNANYSTYEWGLGVADSPVGGGGVSIYPPGVDAYCYRIYEGGSEEFYSSTNNDKVRLSTGQAFPSEENIFIKK